MSENKKYYEAIDGLRTYAIIGIVLMHCLKNGTYNFNGLTFNKIIPSFTNLVFLFMIISGFVMCCGYYDKVIYNRINVEQLYSKRYRKIGCFFSVLCIIDLIISPSKEALYEVFANITLCFGLLPNYNISVIGVGWFLGVVFIFYLLFPFFCYLLFNKKRAWLAFIISLIFNYLCETYFHTGRTNFIYCAVYFLNGGIIYLYRELIIDVTKKKKVYLVLAVISMATVYYLICESAIVLLILFDLILIYSLTLNERGFLINRFTKFIGKISMEIYLSHMVIYRFMESLGILKVLGESIISYVICSISILIGTVLLTQIIKSCIYTVGLACNRILHLKKNSNAIIMWWRTK